MHAPHACVTLSAKGRLLGIILLPGCGHGASRVVDQCMHQIDKLVARAQPANKIIPNTHQTITALFLFLNELCLVLRF